MGDVVGLLFWTGFVFAMGWLCKAFLDSVEQRNNEKNKVWKPRNRRN